MLNRGKDKENTDAKVDGTLSEESIFPSEIRKPGLRGGHGDQHRDSLNPEG